MTRSRRVLLVSSSGGTLLELLALEPWWREQDAVWAAVPAADTRSVLEGRRVRWVPEQRAGRPLALVRATLAAMRMLRRERAEVVVSAGAAAAVPFFVAARLLGIASIWLPTQNMLRRTGPSDRLCGALASAVLVQHESARRGRRDVLVGQLY